MSVPSVVILLPLEGRPRVLVDALREHDEQRLADWLAAHRALEDLVQRAYRLSHEKRREAA